MYLCVFANMLRNIGSFLDFRGFLMFWGGIVGCENGGTLQFSRMWGSGEFEAVGYLVQNVRNVVVVNNWAKHVCLCCCFEYFAQLWIFRGFAAMDLG